MTKCFNKSPRNRNIAVETYLVQTVGRILLNEGAGKRRRHVETKAPCGYEDAVPCRQRHRTWWRTDEDVGTRYSRKNEPSKRRRKQSSEEAVEVMPKTIDRTLS